MVKEPVKYKLWAAKLEPRHTNVNFSTEKSPSADNDFGALDHITRLWKK